MLTTDDNELLTRVGPGTPMGALLRQYWLPMLLSDELTAGGRVMRVRLGGEDLVAFRGPDGVVGAVDEFCSHRRASLYFARNEPGGLRCVYHGWKYGCDGQCLDMPNEPPESSFKDKVRHPAYPCAERGGVIWIYMGPVSPPPAPPELEWTRLPPERRFVSKFWQDCNWMQGLEGGIDPAHISFLHGVVEEGDDGVRRELDQAAAGFFLASQLERAPHLEIADTAYGTLIGASRDAGKGMVYWRITQFHMPMYTMPPTDPRPDPLVHSHIWVPVDDHNLVNWCVSWHPTRALTAEERSAMQAGLSIHVMNYAPATSDAYGDIRPAQHRANDYLCDWDAHRTRKFFGVPGVGAQDKAITESQQRIFDRTREHLGVSDSGIIRIRKRLLDAAVALRDRGNPPPGTAPDSFLIRGASVLLPKDAPWVEGARAQLFARP